MARTIARPINLGEAQNRLPLLGAIGLALLAAIFAFAALRAAGGDGGGGVADDIDVVVASQRIEAGAIVSPDMLEVTALPADALIENALTSLDGLEGLVVRYPIEQGEQITNEKLGQLGTESDGVGSVVPLGMRGFSIEVTEEKIFGGLLTPGDHVDVIGIVTRTVGEEDITESVLLVQNAEVIGVGEERKNLIAREDRDGNPIEDGAISERPDDVEAQPEATSVTLLVTPSDALIIALAQEEGSVWFSVRGPGDNETAPVEPRTLTND
jgi:pilus assembly protein CpaB